MHSRALKERIYRVLKDNKAENIVVADEAIIHYSDYAMLATGTSPRHQKVLAEKVVVAAKIMGVSTPIHSEGMETARWIVVDLGGVVVHLQSQEAREYYEIESLWHGLAAVHNSEHA